MNPKSPLNKLMELHKTLEMYKGRFQDKLKRDYAPSPPPEGLIIGGKAIAAIAVAAGKDTEIYSVAREAMPYIAELRREEVLIRPQSVSNQGNAFKKKKEGNKSYREYGQLYQKYDESLHTAKSKIKEVYGDIIERAFRKLRVYQGNNNQDFKKESYNPFRKSGLNGRVVQLLAYPMTKRVMYPVNERPKYIRATPIYHNKNQEEGGLELLLKAA